MTRSVQSNCPFHFGSLWLHTDRHTHTHAHVHVHMQHSATYHSFCAPAYCWGDVGLQLASANSTISTITPPPHSVALAFILTPPPPRWSDSAVTANRAATTSHCRRQALSLLLDKGQSLAIKATRCSGGG